MRRSSGLMRAISRIIAVMQLVLPMLVSVADARLERDAASARASSHVETTTGNDCAPVHRADCALCQHLTTPTARAGKAAPPAFTGRSEMPAVALRIALASERAERAALPRAPPTA